MIPVLIGAVVAGAAGAAACKLFDDKKPKRKPRTRTWTRIIPESEVPPEVVEEIRQKEIARLKRDSDSE